MSVMIFVISLYCPAVVRNSQLLHGSFMKTGRVARAAAAAGMLLSSLSSLSALTGVASAAAVTEQYTFTKLADTYAVHDNFLEASINNSGEIVYSTRFDGGGGGMYRYAGGSTTTVLETGGAGGQFSSLGPATINSSGAIGFTGTLAAGGRGIFRQSAAGAAITPLYTNASFSTFDRTHITDVGGGAVAFQAHTNAPVTYGLFRGDGSAALSTIASGANMMIFSNDFSANAGGTAAFLGAETVNGALSGAVYTGNGSSPPARVLDDLGPYEIFSSPAISSNGTVLVSAGSDGGLSSPDSPAHLVRITPGQAPLVVAGTEGLFAGFAIYAVNSSGGFATYSALDTPSTYGVFAGPDPITDKVLMTGDVLFDETVTLARISKQGLNDHGQIVIRALTVSGEEMLVLATPVPEPASVAVVGLAAGMLTLRRRRL